MCRWNTVTPKRAPKRSNKKKKKTELAAKFHPSRSCPVLAPPTTVLSSSPPYSRRGQHPQFQIDARVLKGLAERGSAIWWQRPTHAPPTDPSCRGPHRAHCPVSDPHSPEAQSSQLVLIRRANRSGTWRTLSTLGLCCSDPPNYEPG